MKTTSISFDVISKEISINEIDILEISEVKAKQQQYAAINDVYSTKLKQISDAIQQAIARGDTATVVKLQETYTTTNAEWKSKLNAVV